MDLDPEYCTAGKTLATATATCGNVRKAYVAKNPPPHRSVRSPRGTNLQNNWIARSAHRRGSTIDWCGWSWPSGMVMLIVGLPDAVVKASPDWVGTVLVNAGIRLHRFHKPPIRGSSANPRPRPTGKSRPNANPEPRVRQVEIVMTREPARRVAVDFCWGES